MIVQQIHMSCDVMSLIVSTVQSDKTDGHKQNRLAYTYALKKIVFKQLCLKDFLFFSNLAANSQY